MPHQTSSTRNDYERKINYDWPKYELPKIDRSRYIATLLKS